jgi:peroxiredoxin Q/BCP
MALIEPGTRAPNFSLTDQHAEKHTLSKCRGRPVVLYFYPKDDTPDCTVQACQFRDHHPDFSKIDAAVFGISPDNNDSHADFAATHELNFPLLADTARDKRGQPPVCALYGAWQEKTLYGRKYHGVVRTTYLIDENGVVRRRWDRVKVTRHAAEVLATVKLLRGVTPNAAKPAKKRSSETKARRMTRSRGEPARKAPTKAVRTRTAGTRKVRGKSISISARARR